MILTSLSLNLPCKKWELQHSPQKIVVCIKGNCLWRELVTVPDTGKCLVSNSSLTLRHKRVSCLEERANPPIIAPVVAFSPFGPVLSCYRAAAHTPGETSGCEHRGKNSHEIRSPLVPGLLLPHCWASCLLLSSEAKAGMRGRR